MTSSKPGLDVSNRLRSFMWPFIGAAFRLFRQFPGLLTVLGGGFLAGLAAHVTLVLASFRRRPAPGTIPSGGTSGVRHL